jgi:hypothetical protein
VAGNNLRWLIVVQTTKHLLILFQPEENTKNLRCDPVLPPLEFRADVYTNVVVLSQLVERASRKKSYFPSDLRK